MRIALTLLALAAVVAWPPQASGWPADAGVFDLEAELRAQHVQYDGEQILQVTQDGMSLSQAIESVRKRTGGKVLSAETKVQGDREVHHIKVLTKDGKVRTHKVNGRRR
jgi:uncharacterized membrane protein YkoI